LAQLLNAEVKLVSKQAKPQTDEEIV